MTNKLNYLAAGVAAAALASVGLMASAAPGAAPALQSAGALAWGDAGVHWPAVGGPAMLLATTTGVAFLVANLALAMLPTGADARFGERRT